MSEPLDIDAILQTFRKKATWDDIRSYDLWKPVFRWFDEVTGCSQITVRIMGDPWSELEVWKEVVLKEEPDSDILNYHFHRPLLVHHHYSRIHSDVYSQPLSAAHGILKIVRGRKPYRIRDISKAKPGRILKKEDIEALQGEDLDLRAWTCLPLISQRTPCTAVGIITLDLKNNCSQQEQKAFVGANLKKLGDVAQKIADVIHGCWEEKQNQVKKEVRRIVSECFQPTTLLKKLADLITRTFNANAENIRVSDVEVFRQKDIADDGVSTPGAVVRWHPDDRREFTEGKSVAEKVLQRKKSLIVHDLKQEKVETSSRPIASLLAVPITIQDDQSRSIGVITVNSSQLNAFSRYDAELVEAIVSRAAAFIERARIETVLNIMGILIGARNHHQSRDEVLKLIIRNTLTATQCSAGTITIANSNESVIFPDPVKESGDKGEKDTKTEQNNQNDPTTSEEKRSQQKDITFNGRKLGVFELTTSGKQLTDLQESVFSTFVSYAGIVIHNYEQERRVRGLENANWRVMQSRRLPDVLQTIAEMARDLVNATVGLVALLEPDGKSIRFAGVSVHRGYGIRYLPELSLTGKPMGITGRSILERRVIPIKKVPEGPFKSDYVKTEIVKCGDTDYKAIGNNSKARSNSTDKAVQNLQENQLETDDSTPKSDQKSEVNASESQTQLKTIWSELVVPILRPDQKAEEVPGQPAMGALNIQCDREDAFSEYDIEIIKQFATIAALAIHRHNNPPHTTYAVIDDPSMDCDIFLAMKFSSSRRIRWLKRVIQEAADLSPQELKARQSAQHVECPDDNQKRPDQGQTEKTVQYRRKLTVEVANVAGQIGAGVFTYIARCDLLIADMSGLSVNVFYEIGLAHGLNKPVILIGDQNTQIPVDLAGIDFIQYRYDCDDSCARQEIDEQEFILSLAEEIQRWLKDPNPGCPIDGGKESSPQNYHH